MPLRVERALPHMKMLQQSSSAVGEQQSAAALLHGRWELNMVCMLGRNHGLAAGASDERYTARCCPSRHARRHAWGCNWSSGVRYTPGGAMRLRVACKQSWHICFVIDFISCSNQTPSRLTKC